VSVLIVDDHLGTRNTFEWALRSSGVRVATSASGSDAIGLAKSDSLTAHPPNSFGFTLSERSEFLAVEAF
jgi:CheY-like chemotaxis protein